MGKKEVEALKQHHFEKRIKQNYHTDDSFGNSMLQAVLSFELRIAF